MCNRSSISTATTHGRDLGAVATDIRDILHETASEVPLGSTVVLRGQVTTMTSAYAQLIEGLGMAIVLIYLLIVVNFQSWLDPFVIVTALARRSRRHRLDVVRDRNHAVGACVDRCDHVHGRCDREQYPCHQFCA